MERCENCWSLINISQNVPLDVAIPIYGFVLPSVVSITVVTNTFIITVLLQKHLRTPTNLVLLSMAATDLLTGVWLTVFLAIQRYVYVVVPTAIPHLCTPSRTKSIILGIFVFSIILELPALTGKYTTSLPFNGRQYCVIKYTFITMDLLGVKMFYSLLYWIKALFVHLLPCFLLTIFTYKLANTLKKTELRKRSWFLSAEEPEASDELPNNTNSRRSLYATNRMLFVICVVFLTVEIPAAFIFISHYFIATHLLHSPWAYRLLNVALIIRNLLIVLTSPIQFSIYCSMSEQFRLTARQLFSSKLLFVPQAQATFHGGKRYSLILVDVKLIEKKRLSLTRRSKKGARNVEHSETATKAAERHHRSFRSRKTSFISLTSGRRRHSSSPGAR
ncbi:unnamed protein product [Bursaphelenchus okinawaensis]|uniref:G-protein coupled receptors family 1 profile domain-containing protein n=1 Tax=Bursaphelenchus okinawaensis TaxID=465554 RepID=A0A811KQR5_9BILA|nr:unnamed protein product [Bursaphelenchus okinawaensis]CAG9108207.1 unnamed protein product [Bursaphelenchus okinawaensis]